MKKLTSFKDSVGLFIVLNFACPDFVEFAITSVPKQISLEDLSNFIKNFNKYIEFSEEDISNLAIPFQIFKSSIFQIQALERGVNSDGEEYITLNFMLSLAQSRGKIVQPCVGVKGAVTFDNLRRFVSSIQEVITELLGK